MPGDPNTPKGSAEQNSPAGIAIEWVQDAEKDRDISVDNKYPAMESQNQGFSRGVQDNQAIGDATKSISDGTGGAGQMEKANFKLESSPQDSVVNMTYGLPASLYPDSVFVEVVVFNFMGAQVAKPVNGIHKPGTYTAHLHKRALPDGVYFFLLQLDRQNVRAVRRTLNLIWEDRK